MGRIAVLASTVAFAAQAWAGVPAGPDAVAGFDRSLFAEAAREAGRGVVFAVLSREAALDAGRLDVAAGPYPPDGVKGHRPLAPVAANGDALLKRRGDGSVRVPGDAAGKVLGIMGPPAGAALHARVASPPPIYADPLRDLAAGRVAALAGALAEVADAALARPDDLAVVGPAFGRTARLAPLVRRDRPDVGLPLDAARGRMKADGRLAKVQRRWFGIAFDPPAPPAAVP